MRMSRRHQPQTMRFIWKLALVQCKSTQSTQSARLISNEHMTSFVIPTVDEFKKGKKKKKWKWIGISELNWSMKVPLGVVNKL